MAALASIDIALYWPASRAQAVMIGMMLSFILFAIVVVMVFAARSACRAWTNVVICAAFEAGLWAFMHLGVSGASR